jgi:hypothetical protein
MVAYSGGQGNAMARVAEPARMAEAENREIAGRNAATKRGLIKESWQESQLRERQGLEEDRIRERQRLDDRRTAEAADISGRDDTWNELIAREDFAESIPHGFDIRRATHADVMDIKAKYWGAKLGDDSLGLAVTAYDELNRTRRDLTGGKSLNININEKGKVGIGLSERSASGGGDGKVKTKSGLTPGQLSAIAKELGPDVGDITAMELSEINKLRAARGNAKNLTQSEEEKYADYSYVLDSVSELLDMIDTGSVGGAETLGFATNDEAARFRAKASNAAKDIPLRIKSGAATSPADDAKIAYFTVALGNLTRNNRAALMELADWIGPRRNAIELGMPDWQRREMRLRILDKAAGVNDAPGVPSEFVEGS